MSKMVERAELPRAPADGLVLKSVNLKPTWVNPSEAFPQVNSFADLPLASDSLNEIYYVTTSTGVWLINRKSRGFYRSNGVLWEYAGELLESLNSNNFRVYDGEDSSKQIKLNLEAIASDKTVQLNVPDRDVDLGLEGQANVAYNLACESSVNVGAAVYLTGASVLDNADASAVGTSDVVGIVIEKPTQTTANVLTAGLTPPVFTGLNAGLMHFLASDGGLTSTVPVALVLAPVGTAFSSTQLFVKIQSRTVKS